MSTSNNQSQTEGTYFIDLNSMTETARLMYQDRLITKQMRGVLNEHTSERIGSMKYVLDLACGPGGWGT